MKKRTPSKKSHANIKRILEIAFKYLPLVVGLGIIAIGSFFVPWGDVWPLVAEMSPITMVVLVALGIVFYLSRILRYGFILRALGQPLSFWRLTLAYFVAQPVTLLPGGEMYRSITLKKHGNISKSNGIPSVFAQSLTEGLGLVIIALISAIALNKHVLIVAAVTFVYLSVLGAVHIRNEKRSHSLVNKLPLVNISRYRMSMFIGKNKTLLGGSNLAVLFLTSFASTLVATLALFVTALSFGAEINLMQAAIAFALPMILQSVTFLPGGIGVNEQGSVGVLLLFGVPLPVAVAITLVMRFITLGLGLVLGSGAIAFTKLSKHETS